MSSFSYLYFGSSAFSVHVLNTLSHAHMPRAVVTFPDKPQGRKLVLTPNPVKVWAQENGVEVIEVLSFKDEQTIETLKQYNADLFVVASFGKILPDSVIYMAKAKTLNVHPSLLPKLRGPAPIQGAILEEDKTGVAIMRLNDKMDEGPIIAQKKIEFPTWPIGYLEAEQKLGEEGGTLLGEVMQAWVDGKIEEQEQDSTQATYTKKIKKEDSDISNDSPEVAYKKILAYEHWPRARKGDLIVTKAHLESEELVFDRVIPPGKKEMAYKDYMKGVK